LAGEAESSETQGQGTAEEKEDCWRVEEVWQAEVVRGRGYLVQMCITRPHLWVHGFGLDWAALESSKGCIIEYTNNPGSIVVLAPIEFLRFSSFGVKAGIAVLLVYYFCI